MSFITNTSRLLATSFNSYGQGFIEGPGYSPATAPEANDAGNIFTDFISNMVGLLTIVAGLAFLLYFMIGALNWVQAGGDKTKVEAAKNQLTAAAIGLIVVVASYAIAAIVGEVLGIDLLFSTNDGTATINSLSP